MPTGTFSATAAPLTAIPSLALWLRGAGANDTALFGTITSWYDQSTTVLRNFTTSAGTKPDLYQVSGKSSVPALMRSPQGLRFMDFAAGETISCTEATLLKNKPGATAFLVSSSYAAANDLLLAKVDTDNQTRLAIGHGQMKCCVDDTTTVTASCTGVFTNTNRGWGLTYGTVGAGALTVNHIASDGTKASATGAPASQSFANTNLSSLAVTSAAAGYVAEIAVYERALNDSEINRIVAYLCHKYRIAR